MKEIVVISGKGGTGKTSITAAFGVLGGQDIVLADCDVDAADMHLLMEPDFGNEEAFFSGELAVIDQDRCSGCGACAEACRFDAIPIVDGKYVVQDLNCEGCGYCARICPVDAITNVQQNVGNWYRSKVKTGGTDRIRPISLYSSGVTAHGSRWIWRAAGVGERRSAQLARSLGG